MKSPWSFATSPRSPNVVIERFIPLKRFDKQPYNKELQIKIGKHIRENSNKKVGLKSHNSQLDFVARDFLTRTPKKLGLIFVPGVDKGDLTFTEQGNNLIKTKYPNFIMQRQIAKWQYPSPNSAKGTSHLEIIPLTSIIYILKQVKDLSRTELATFVGTLESYKDIDNIINNILNLRIEIKNTKGNLKRRNLRKEESLKQMKIYYKNEINKTIREKKGKQVTEEIFYIKKYQNHKDYADAAFRYFLSTGLFKINKRSKLEISNLNKLDAEYLLKTIGIKPAKIKMDIQDYVFNFLGKEKSIKIFSDDEENLNMKLEYLSDNAKKIGLESSFYKVNFLKTDSLDNKNGIIIDFEKKINYMKMENYIKELSLRKNIDFQDILELFDNIKNNEVEILDRPLQYEWNFFRIFSFIGGFKKIIPSLKFDEDVNPLHTSSSVPDLIIEYENFSLIVEVTLTVGARQYEAEGAPVFRHVGKYQKENPNKRVFGLFVADKLDINMPIEFLSRAQVNTNLYDGKVKILPMDRLRFSDLFSKIYKDKLDYNFILNIFNEMLSDNVLEEFRIKGEVEWIKKLDKLC